MPVLQRTRESGGNSNTVQSGPKPLRGYDVVSGHDDR
jgi:hypothetical protein